MEILSIHALPHAPCHIYLGNCLAEEKRSGLWTVSVHLLLLVIRYDSLLLWMFWFRYWREVWGGAQSDKTSSQCRNLFPRILKGSERTTTNILYRLPFVFFFFPFKFRLYLSYPSVLSVQLQTIILPGLMLKKSHFTQQNVFFLIMSGSKKGVQLENGAGARKPARLHEVPKRHCGPSRGTAGPPG